MDTDFWIVHHGLSEEIMCLGISIGLLKVKVSHMSANSRRADRTGLFVYKQNQSPIQSVSWQLIYIISCVRAYHLLSVCTIAETESIIQRMLGSMIIRYTTGFLHQLKMASLQTENYGNFLLRQQTRANIINLGICRQPTNKVYRRSKGGKKLFHKITSIINNKHFNCYTQGQEQANLGKHQRN